MGTQSLIVREAKAEDINEIIIINSIGFADYMNSKMGKAYIKAFYHWFIDRQQNTDGISLVICSGDRIAGFVVGARIGYQKSLNKKLLIPAAIGFMIHPWLLLQKSFLTASVLKIKVLFPRWAKNVHPSSLVDNGISLVGISIHPDFRGRKAGSSLMQAFEQKAKEFGYDYMRLSVYKENIKARQLYSKNNWKVSENESSEFYYYKEIINDL